MDQDGLAGHHAWTVSPDEWHVESLDIGAYDNLIEGWYLSRPGTKQGWIDHDGDRFPLAVSLPSVDVAVRRPGSTVAKACRFAGLLPEAIIGSEGGEFWLEFELWDSTISRIGPFQRAWPTWRVVAERPENWLRATDDHVLVRASCSQDAGGAAPRWHSGTDATEWTERHESDGIHWESRVRRRVVAAGLVLHLPSETGDQVHIVRLAPQPTAAMLAAGVAHPSFNRPATRTPATAPAAQATPSARRASNGRLCVVTVCTVNHLHFARALASSVRAHHPDIDVFAVIADGDQSLPALDGDLNLIAATSIRVNRLPFLALKYSAIDLCCALKPFAVEFVLTEMAYDEALYIDSDVRVFAPLTTLIDSVHEHDLVVTPHTFSPMPNPERPWERPRLGDVTEHGMMNAGIFGMRRTIDTLHALETWKELVSQTGAFVRHSGQQTEQHSFNWLSVFVKNVKILRDTTYNVAYWNLHERTLRWVSADQGDGGDYNGRWLIDGRPLVAFHFSGFSPFDRLTLSRHQSRFAAHQMPALARLLDFYADTLIGHGAEVTSTQPYGFESFSSGIPLDDLIRDCVKDHEDWFFVDTVDPWTELGEQVYCAALLSPIPYTGSALPALFQHVYSARPDLQGLFPMARTQPETMLPWWSKVGLDERGWRQLFNRHRATRVPASRLRALQHAATRYPTTIDDLDAPLGRDLDRLCCRLDSVDPTLATGLRGFSDERISASAITTVRQLLEERDDLARAFPDPLGLSAEGLAEWLDVHAPSEAGTPPTLGSALRHVRDRRGLARVFSMINRSPTITSVFPKAMVGESSHQCARWLLEALRHGVEFDVDDIFAYLWTMDTQPWSGLSLTLELAVHLSASPSTFLPEGQESLLKEQLTTDWRFRRALEEHRRTHHSGPTADRDADRVRRIGVDPVADAEPPTQVVSGTNLFGYFQTPIGLGAMSRGLAAALDQVQIPWSENLIGNDARGDDLEHDALIQQFVFDHEINVFVSYPHIREQILRTVPRYMTSSRRNIAYLAWEQREGAPGWKRHFAEFDDVWALSPFAAASLSATLGRSVSSLPCVVDTRAFPPAADPAEFGLPAGTTFLYTFDANSSIERKNPEAALTAFSRAFGTSPDAALVIKISNGASPRHARRLASLGARVRDSGSNVVIIDQTWAHRDVLRLISACDCYVSLHRAEGFGYTCAEAMSYGKPVIATNYSGNLTFMNSENSLLVDCDEIEVTVADGPFARGSLWADPDIDHAAALMRSVVENPSEAATLGKRAHDTIATEFSAGRIGAAVRSLLRA